MRGPRAVPRRFQSFARRTPVRQRGGTRAHRRCWLGGRIPSVTVVCVVWLCSFTGCTPPIYQFELRDRPLTCDEANTYAYHTLENLGFSVTAFDPAVIGHPGTLHGRRKRDAKKVTVVVTCKGRTADIDASEDGKWLGQLDFKRSFYLSFTSTAEMAALEATAAHKAAAQPLAKKSGGLQVLIKPVRGLAAKLDFDLDLAAADVLPVRVTIDNGTTRTYLIDPMEDIALVGADGTRVHPLSMSEVTRRVVHKQASAAAGGTPLPSTSRAEIAHRLGVRALQAHTVTPGQRVSGYLFFQLAPYATARVSTEDQQTGETEGFIVEF